MAGYEHLDISTGTQGSRQLCHGSGHLMSLELFLALVKRYSHQHLRLRNESLLHQLR